MTIIYDHDVFGWQEYGGVSRYFYELAKSISSTYGQDVRIVAPVYVNQYLKQDPDGLKVWGLPARRLPKMRRVMRVVNSLLAAPAMSYFQPDIVHETYYSTRRLAPRRAKVVLTVFDMIHEKFSGDYRKSDPTRKEKEAAVRRADHIICISEQTREDLIELLGVERARTSVIYLGLSTMNPAGPTPALAMNRRPFLLYVGARQGYKNFESLLGAYAASAALRRDFELICFGGGGFSAKERAMINRLGLGEESVRHASGDDAILAAYYRSASAFIYPSLYEGFGIPPLEAMGQSCPVICSGVSSIPEVVGDAAEMFDPRDVQSMVDAIERVVYDEEARRVLIERGHERLRLFSWDRCARETLDVYRKVLA